MSEPPEGHISAQEAARILGLSDERIRQMIRERTLKGEGPVYEEGRLRYWADAADVERRRRERQRPPTVSDVESVQETSREIALRAIAEIIAAKLDMTTEQMVRAIMAQERAIVAEIQSQREEVAAKLDEMRGSVDAGVEIISEQSRKLDARSQAEVVHQERVRRHEQELIEVARNAAREAGSRPRWLVASIISILLLALLGVTLIFLIFLETTSIL